jgi:transcriptional regulator with XRE-family HTH domain
VDLGAEAGLTHNFINDLEHGRRGFSPATLDKLARALGVGIFEFFLPIVGDNPYPDQITDIIDHMVYDSEDRAQKLKDILRDLRK